MKLHLATDHAGFAHKEALKKHLLGQGMEVVDHGATELVPEDDYPDFILPAAHAVAQEEGNFGIVFGGSGQGEAMAANRIAGVRCAVFYGGGREVLRLSREHNNANMLSIGARFVGVEEMIECVSLWLAIPFSNEKRHIRRISKF